MVPPKKKNRHSVMCPCNEHITAQTRYFHPLLNKLNGGSAKKRSEILKKCDPCFVRYLGHCASGILTSSIKLPKKEYKKLGGSKKLLLTLADDNKSISAKRRALVGQSGGGVFIPILVAAASALISSLIQKAIK